MNRAQSQQELDPRIGAPRATPLTVTEEPMRTSTKDTPAPFLRTPSDPPRLVSILGARPEIIQAAPLARALAPYVEEILVHTGQHYDAAMSGTQIEHTELPEPTYNLAIGSQDDLVQLEMGESHPAVLDLERPDAVLVRGDTNGTLSGAKAAKRRGLPLIHVEAGLRSHREGMPEERNRVRTDHLSDLLLAPTESARENLLAEGVRGEIHVTGDVMCDMLLRWAERIGRRPSAAMCSRPCTATTTRTMPSASRSCSTAWAPPTGASCSRCIRARARRWPSSACPRRRTSRCWTRFRIATCSRSSAAPT